jgi:Protein of unknown function (DUF4019)
MRPAAFIAAIILLSVTGAQSQQSDIQVERLGERSYRLVLKSFKSGSVAAGQQELVPAARRVCSDQSIRFGKYEFEKSEPIRPATAENRPFLLKQEVHCGNAASEPATPSTATRPDPDWRPTAELEKAIELLTYTYFSWKDARNYKQAYALLSTTTPFEQWQSSAEKFNSQAGEVRSRKIKKITWYKDPAHAPQPGLYAAVDFAGQFVNVDTHCGYVVWHQGPKDSSFRLVREEENFIPKEIGQKLSPSELAAIRAKFRC